MYVIYLPIIHHIIEAIHVGQIFHMTMDGWVWGMSCQSVDSMQVNTSRPPKGGSISWIEDRKNLRNPTHEAPILKESSFRRNHFLT